MSIPKHHTHSRVTRRAGFSLVEIMVAMVILVIVLTTLAALLLTVAKKSTVVSGRSAQTGLLTLEVDRAVAVPIESLAVRLGTTRTDTPMTKPWPMQRTVAISGRADSLTVYIAVRPLNAAQRADSVTQRVLRTR